ncbi:MAG: hypothetical protein NT062_08350 [Proteobacteria bacterium]|nr:hypothetical protein [Pseudomonadota bacterium]
MHRLLPLLLLCTTSLAAAEGLVVKQLDKARVPAGIKVKGTQVREVWGWTAADKTPGFLILSATSRTTKVTSRQLYGQIWTGAKLREARLISDGVDGCKLDLVANFVAGSVSIRDEDADGTPEISFAYDLACSATADPVARKLLVVEGATKHALRGRSMGKDPDDKVIGGDVQLDPFAGEAVLRKWAEGRWKALLATEPTTFE